MPTISWRWGAIPKLMTSLSSLENKPPLIPSVAFYRCYWTPVRCWKFKDECCSSLQHSEVRQKLFIFPTILFLFSSLKKKIRFLAELMAPRNKTTLLSSLASGCSHVTKSMRCKYKCYVKLLGSVCRKKGHAFHPSHPLYCFLLARGHAALAGAWATILDHNVQVIDWRWKKL